MKAIIFLALLFFAPTASSYTQQCGDGCLEEGERPTCSELGYKKSTLTSCPEGYITCPYDEGDGSTYIWCKSYECHDGDLFEPSEVSGKLEEGYVCYKTPYHEHTCYTCVNEESDPCIWSEENKGEAEISEQEHCENGKYGKCTPKCQNVTIPSGEGVIAKTRICNACGNAIRVVSGYECHPNYQDTGNGCEYKTCPTPTTYTNIAYSTNVTNCSGKGFADGWIFETNGTENGLPCGRCIPKECVPPYVPASQAPCDKTGIAQDGIGYTMTDYGHSGDEWCRKCESWECESPYSTTYQSISDCSKKGYTNKAGWTVEKGYDFSTDSENEHCGKCDAKTCPTGYNEVYQSIDNCPNTSGYTFVKSSDVFHGTDYCGKCEVKACTQGQTNLTISGCSGYPGTIGLTIQNTSYYSGSDVCKECVCDTSASGCTYAQTSAGGKTALGEGGVGGQPCCDGTYKTCENTGCTGKEGSCPDNAICNTTCTACGVTYYKATSCNPGYTLNTTANKCVEDTCDTWGLTDPDNCDSNAYVCTPDGTHSECCKTCSPKTCANHNASYLESKTGSETCSTGYQRTNRYGLASGTSTINCYDCNTCASLPGYLNSCPVNATSCDEQYSCTTKKYCANGCKTGWKTDGCNCVENVCGNDYKSVTSTSNLVYFDKLECKKGNTTLYKTTGCASSYTTQSACAAQNGYLANPVTEQNMTCGTCYVCDNSKCGNTCGTSTNSCSGITYTASNVPSGTHPTGDACHKVTKSPSSNTCVDEGYFYPSFECDNSNYVWNGSACVPTSCQSGIPESQKNSMQASYPGGYTFTKNGHKAGDEDCYDYSANSCAAGSATFAAGCGDGTAGDAGWETGSATGYYAGQSPCYACGMKNCPTGYATSVTSCGSGFFSLSSSWSGYYGDTPCYQCVCDDTHCGSNCLTELNTCSNHPYANAIDNATMTGLCTIQTKSQDICNTPQTVYSGFTCNQGYTKNSVSNPTACVCDTAYGYYSTCPKGANCPTPESGECYSTNSCRSGWMNQNNSNHVYFSYDNTSTFYQRVGLQGDMTCLHITGCADGYYTQSQCNDGNQIWTQKASFGDYACGTCETVGTCMDSSSANHYSTLSACNSARLRGGMFEDFTDKEQSCVLDQSHYLTDCHRCSYNGNIYYEQRCKKPTVPDVSGTMSCSVAPYDYHHYQDAIVIDCGYKQIGNTKCPYFTTSYPNGELGWCDVSVMSMKGGYQVNCLSTQQSTGMWTEPSNINFRCEPPACSCPSGYLTEEQYNSISEGREYLAVTEETINGCRCYNPTGCKNNTVRDYSTVIGKDYFGWTTLAYPGTNITCSFASTCAEGYSASQSAYYGTPAYYCAYSGISGGIPTEHHDVTTSNYAFHPYGSNSYFECSKCRYPECSDYYCPCDMTNSPYNSCDTPKLINYGSHSECTGSTKTRECFQAQTSYSSLYSFTISAKAYPYTKTCYCSGSGTHLW